MGIMETSLVSIDQTEVLLVGSIEILPHIKAMIPSMSKSDAKVARLLLKSPNDFICSSVRTIAAEVGVSEPTIVRFCRNVGCEGFKDLKFKIMQELANSKVRGDVSDAVSEAVRGPGIARSDHRDISEAIYNKALEVMRSACNAIDILTIQKAARAIAQTNRVFIYGVGGSSAVVADELHNRLIRLGVPSCVYRDNYSQLMSAATVLQKDVVIFISSSGRPRALQDSLELAKHYGATCIAITDSDSLLGRETDICLHAGENTIGVHEFQPNPIRYAQLLVIDSLVYILASELGEKARSSLRRVRASVATMNGVSAQLPISD